MTIHNNPTITDNEQINILRSQMQQRAQWLYYICDAAKKSGVETEAFCREGIYNVGCVRGAQMVESFADKGDLIALGESFKNHPNAIAFEKEFIAITEDRLEMDFHHCPLVAAWQQATDDETLIERYCDIAMDGDRGLFSNIPDSEFILESTIAAGAPVCKLIVQRLKNK